MKTIIAVCALTLLMACSTTIKTIDAVDPTTGVAKYTSQSDRLIYADVEAKGFGKISKTVKFNDNGDLIEYSVFADPTAGATDIMRQAGQLGATAAGMGVNAFKFVVPID